MKVLCPKWFGLCKYVGKIFDFEVEYRQGAKEHVAECDAAIIYTHRYRSQADDPDFKMNVDDGHLPRRKMTTWIRRNNSIISSFMLQSKPVYEIFFETWIDEFERLKLDVQKYNTLFVYGPHNNEIDDIWLAIRDNFHRIMCYYHDVEYTRYKDVEQGIRNWFIKALPRRDSRIGSYVHTWHLSLAMRQDLLKILNEYTGSDIDTERGGFCPRNIQALLSNLRELDEFDKDFFDQVVVRCHGVI